MDDVLLELFIRGAAGGVSKTQLLRSFKDEHGCSEEDLDFLIESAFFKEKPRRISYKEIYDRPLKERATIIGVPCSIEVKPSESQFSGIRQQRLAQIQASATTSSDTNCSC